MSKIRTWAGWTYRFSFQTPSALRHDYVSESPILSVSVVVSWTALLFSLSQGKPLFHCFGLSDGLMCLVLVSEKFRRQRDSNITRKKPSEFWSNAFGTPPWLHNRFFEYIGVGRSILNCCVTFFLFLVKLITFLYLGLSEGLTLCWIMVSEKWRCQQDSNVRRKTQSDL